MQREDLRIVRGRVSVVIEAPHERGHRAPYEAFCLGGELVRRGFAVRVRLVGGSNLKGPPGRPALKLA
jgi:hypothetical protein